MQAPVQVPTITVSTQPYSTPPIKTALPQKDSQEILKKTIVLTGVTNLHDNEVLQIFASVSENITDDPLQFSFHHCVLCNLSRLLQWLLASWRVPRTLLKGLTSLLHMGLMKS